MLFLLAHKLIELCEFLQLLHVFDCVSHMIEGDFLCYGRNQMLLFKDSTFAAWTDDFILTDLSILHIEFRKEVCSKYLN